jgi:NADH dehydrogenase
MQKRILILGGGFSGLYTALELEKKFDRSAEIEITLVNKDNFFLFTPMLHEVAASDLDLAHIVNPVRKLLRKVIFFNGDVESIDLNEKNVVVSHGDDHHHHDLQYDYLVLALGSITNFFNLPGLKERALTMKTLGDAIHLRNRMIANLEEADFECCTTKRKTLLTFVVAGGGFAGVETVASMNDFLRSAIRYYRHLKEEMLRIVLVHPGAYILPELGEELGRYSEKILRKRNVNVRTNIRVKSIEGEAVQLSDGTMFQAGTVVWTAGTSPNPLLSSLPCEKERGRVKVNEFLEVPGWSGVYALGDCAVITDPKTGMPYPPTAQHALREGKVAAQNLIADLSGGKKKPFIFSTIGLLASIGRRTGVARIFGKNFSGFLAWWMWRTIYLSKLPGFEKKLRVALDWTLDLIFSKDLVQFLTFRAPIVSHTEEKQPEMRPKAVNE